MASSPTQKSIAHLKNLGYMVGIVEHYNAFSRRRHDLFNFIDILAVHPKKKQTLGVQTTTQRNISNHMNKMLPMEKVRLWLESGNLLEIHGWVKRGKKGKRKLWELDCRKITLKDLRKSKLLLFD